VGDDPTVTCTLEARGLASRAGQVMKLPGLGLALALGSAACGSASRGEPTPGSAGEAADSGGGGNAGVGGVAGANAAAGANRGGAPNSAGGPGHDAWGGSHSAGGDDAAGSAGTGTAGAGSAGAPPEQEPECEAEQTRASQLACGLNGRGRVEEVCVEGEWQLSAICRDGDVCLDATLRPGTTACGLNLRGRLEQACQLGAWHETTTCRDDVDVCVDGAQRLGLGACGLNGRGHLADRCDAGTWVTTTACTDPDTCRDGASEGRRRYELAAVPAGQSCNAEDQSRQCVMGSWSAWSGSFPHPACSVLPPACGNARVEAGELCDDGNVASGDGCASGCAVIEPSYACATNDAARSVCTQCVVLVGPGGAVESGQRWAEAYTDLSHGIERARALVDQASCSSVGLWVAEGRYSPRESPGEQLQNRSFRLDRTLQVLGGFAGTEWLASARDWQAHRTVLTGDNSGNDATSSSRGDNSLTVVTVTGTGTTLDGFTITAGHGAEQGGGIAAFAPSITLRNLVIEDNFAYRGGGLAHGAERLRLENVQVLNNSATYGGGMFDVGRISDLESSTASLKTTVFRSNLATSSGGAIYGTSRPLQIEGAIFEGNEADTGGAVRLLRGGSTLNRVVFRDNLARTGGAIAFQVADAEEYIGLSNALLLDNAASQAGGALYFSGYGSASVLSSTFAGNSAPAQHGGAVYSQSFRSYDEYGLPQENSGRVSINNSILWGNAGGEVLGRGTLASFDHPLVNCIQGFPASASFVACQVGATPFANPSHGDYRLRAQSAAIDSGTDAAAAPFALDLDGRPRIAGGRVDLGCYEQP
jgi:cysteine-rich repeat protein/predicted outer membrane repeat protein